MSSPSLLRIAWLGCSLTTPAFAQLSPYLTVTSAVKETVTEVGPQYKKGKGLFRLYSRLPLTDKTNSISQIDRSTDSWRIIGSGSHRWASSDTTTMRGDWLSVQAEFGRYQFEYYPTGVKSSATKKKDSHSSFALEAKTYFYRASDASKWQTCLQARLRFARDYKAADEVGVIQPANSNGVVTVDNFIIAGPSVRPVLSPAVAFNFAHDKLPVSYTPVIYYDLKGYKGATSPFDLQAATDVEKQGVQRLRLEFWVFGYPTSGPANIAIGASPYFSVRTAGKDDDERVMLGGQLTIRASNPFLFFF